MSRPPATPTALAPSIDNDLKALLRKVKLGRLLDTLPERLALARTESLPHADFLALVLSDEVERRDRSSAELRARTAKLDPSMRLETFTTDSTARYDRELWNELCSLRFLGDTRGALVLGPVGVGKTHLATALGAWVRKGHEAEGPSGRVVVGAPSVCGVPVVGRRCWGGAGPEDAEACQGRPGGL